MNKETRNKIRVAQIKSEEMFVERARLQYEVNRCNGLQVTLVACFIAWFSLYLTEAIKTNEDVFVVLTMFGLVTMPLMIIVYYRKGRKLSSEAARIEARIHMNNMFNHGNSKEDT
ncbi:hypothetical protein K6675_003172 [Vibrio parahaemolyticus]|uniref:hypothetical protein n=1 Tax=Vibrio parahaemolyticus TaxID=670 RepID=UPI000470DA2D|nr:hypothetical protein [Vibrio parahaemolyticus]EGQ8413944.1 hypothetical protein [Vibrio parahaemolyticus]EGQ9446331.1 hypothetical protein [Vibrio parahaemolyticus]EGQ9532678.1 hypothetical protein [Vibrio parahaemolyticus]EHK2864380.1 hypothetical protein [Vibrio parahaemolyticus]EHK9100266.1 hypothetical protein [Vibrio parahaemolyticus]